MMHVNPDPSIVSELYIQPANILPGLRFPLTRHFSCCQLNNSHVFSCKQAEFNNRFRIAYFDREQPFGRCAASTATTTATTSATTTATATAGELVGRSGFTSISLAALGGYSNFSTS